MRIEVYVRPGASTTKVGGTYRDALLVRVTARATEGKATRAVLQSVAKTLSLPARSITVFGGARTRNKILEIEAPSGREEAIANRVAELRALT